MSSRFPLALPRMGSAWESLDRIKIYLMCNLCTDSAYIKLHFLLVSASLNSYLLFLSTKPKRIGTRSTGIQKARLDSPCCV
jgi:hypothetical protein